MWSEGQDGVTFRDSLEFSDIQKGVRECLPDSVSEQDSNLRRLGFSGSIREQDERVPLSIMMACVKHPDKAATKLRPVGPQTPNSEILAAFRPYDPQTESYLPSERCTIQPGTRVEVYSERNWWNAEVLTHDLSNNMVTIRYLNCGEESDETISAFDTARIRLDMRTPLNPLQQGLVLRAEVFVQVSKADSTGRCAGKGNLQSRTGTGAGRVTGAKRKLDSDGTSAEVAKRKLNSDGTSTEVAVKAASTPPPSDVPGTPPTLPRQPEEKEEEEEDEDEEEEDEEEEEEEEEEDLDDEAEDSESEDETQRKKRGRPRTVVEYVRLHVRYPARCEDLSRPLVMKPSEPTKSGTVSVNFGRYDSTQKRTRKSSPRPAVNPPFDSLWMEVATKIDELYTTARADLRPQPNSWLGPSDSGCRIVACEGAQRTSLSPVFDDVDLLGMIKGAKVSQRMHDVSVALLMYKPDEQIKRVASGYAGQELRGMGKQPESEQIIAVQHALPPRKKKREQRIEHSKNVSNVATALGKLKAKLGGSGPARGTGVFWPKWWLGQVRDQLPEWWYEQVLHASRTRRSGRTRVHASRTRVARECTRVTRECARQVE